MRTLGFPLGLVAMTASLAAPSVATGQRNARRSAPNASLASQEMAAPRSAPASVALPNASRCATNCDDYALVVVSALLPSETSGQPSDMVTLVIENRGTVSAPASLVSVAPRNHLSLARRSTIPMLAPGQRAVVQLPVAVGPDGTPCISITITDVPAVDPAIARFLATVIPDPQIGSGAWGGLASTDSWTGFSPFSDIGRSEYFGGLADW